ncbi:dynamin family protein [Epibacterium ulvae]|uniref:dynamin family protein n=1 Tax=Epibacterium ulvae TaxID=1156985 RepID=UPI001BFCBDC5|nr:dynamin family protein [Epibacterium ulvae]MBT8155676.1 dynamin family protein [Epibacterium ulvae]
MTVARPFSDHDPAPELVEPTPKPQALTDIRAASAPGNLQAGLEPLATLAQRRGQLLEALESLNAVSGDAAQRALGRLKSELVAYEPAVTVLGQVKSGKTALVNAMAGWSDLLPSDVNPWTSVVTSLHLSPDTARAETSARFRFMTEGEWDRLLTKGGRIGEMAGRAGAESELQKIREQIEAMRDRSRKRLGRKFEMLMGQSHDYGYFDKNLIERYICLGDDFEDDDSARDDQGRFADITRSADLYLNSGIVPHPLCLRDTPGVNDTFMMREQITIQAVRDSRMCVVVLSASQALTSVDLGLIRMIASLDSREVVIFVNRIDELADPANQIPEIEAAIRETLRLHHGPQEAEILFGSAFWANAALMGQLDGLPKASSDALLNWAEACVASGQTRIAKGPAQNMVWQLSGLPALHRVLGGRILRGEGKATLARIATSALTVASGQDAAHAIRIQANRASARKGEVPVAALTPDAVRMTFERLADRHMETLEADLDVVLASYRERADRAHATFIDRATRALIEHLEQWGDESVWEYDPAGLRLLLRTAYSVMSTRLQAAAQSRYEAAVRDVAGLLHQGFGSAVEGVQLAVPQVPNVTAPVALGQTIALDFNDGWWASWWRRTRGYSAFASRFRALIQGETEDFMIQLKSVQVADTRAKFLARLQGFFDEQRDILSEITDAQAGDLRMWFSDQELDAQHKASRAALDVLKSYAA